MKEAQFVSISAHPHLESCSETTTNQNKQLLITFSIRGLNATGYCKDLITEFNDWQIANPEQLHQKILDLLSFARQKRLELEFALSFLIKEKIIFATYSGAIILKRNDQVRKILESNQEINMIVGNFRDNDQIILSNQSGRIMEKQIFMLLENNSSLEKMVSEISLIREKYNSLNESIAFLTYEEKVPEIKEKIDFQTIVKKTLEKAKVFSKKILEIAKKIIAIVKKIVIKVKNQGKKKILIELAVLTTLVLTVFIFVSVSEQQNKKINDNINQKITTITKDVQNIDQLVAQQPLLARENVQKSLNELEALKKEKNNKSSLKLIEAEIEKLKLLVQEISGSNSLDKLSIAYDLGDFLGKKIETNNNQIFILENNGKDILKINADNSKEKITLTNNEQIKDFTISENKLFVLSSGIKMLDLTKNENNFTDIKQEGESDKNGELLSSFGPYLYLLNKTKRNIYRYYYSDDKLSDPIGWLIDKQGVNFDNINDLLVDGDLWMANKNGDLAKFSKGTNTDFRILGLGNLPNTAITLAANESTNSLALLEKQNKRLILITKDGQLINEIKSNELSGVNSIAFNSAGNKIYAVSGSIIYEIEVLK